MIRKLLLWWMLALAVVAGSPAVASDGPAGKLGLIKAQQAQALATASSTQIVRVDQRSPGANDDAAHGYAAGDYWRTSVNLWQNLRSTAGVAAWQPVGLSGPLLGDALGVTPAAAYGTRKVVNAWTGASLQVIRASDSTTKDIPFVSNVADVGTLQAFCAATTCKITKAYDQSGNSNDAVQTTDAQRPVVYATIVNGALVISIEGPAKTGGNTYLDIPTTLATNRRLVSVFAVSTPTVDGAAAWSLGQAGELTIYANGGDATGMTKAYIGAPTNAQPQTSANLSLTGWFEPVDGQFGTITDDRATGPIGTVATTALTGGRIGATTLSGTLSSNSANWQAFIVWPNLVTVAQVDMVRRAAYRQFAIQPQFRDNIVAAGDSITVGYKGWNDNYPNILMPMLPRPMRLWTMAIPGWTLDQISAYVGQRLASNYVPGARNIAIVWGGTNNVKLAGETPAVAYAKLQALCLSMKAAGYKVIVLTMLPRNDWTNNTTGEATRQSFNALIVAGWSGFADRLVDVGSDPTMGTTAASNNTALYGDGIHPTAMGYSYLMTKIAAAVSDYQTSLNTLPPWWQNGRINPAYQAREVVPG